MRTQTTYATIRDHLLTTFILNAPAAEHPYHLRGHCGHLSEGLGRATATHIVKNGGRVVLADLPGSEGAAVAAELGSSAVFAPTDVTSEDDVVVRLVCYSAPHSVSLLWCTGKAS